MEAFERLKEIQSLFDDIMKQKSDVGKDYSQLVDRIISSGSIPQKYKELIFVALSLAKKCEWCLSYHLRKAVESGVTYDELIEVAFISFLMDGTPSLMESIKMKDFYSDLVNAGDIKRRDD
ncbi:MAG: carboxymuconolactone decarboxylase family protein [Thermoplasmatales archaeon]